MKYDELYEMYVVESLEERERLTTMFFDGMGQQMKIYLNNFCEMKGYGKPFRELFFKTFFDPWEEEYKHFPERSVWLIFRYPDIPRQFEEAGFFITYEEFYEHLMRAVKDNLANYPDIEREKFANEKMTELKQILNIQ